MPEKDIFLVLLETSGNQAYIFSTNKLRDVVGASELTYRVGTRFVEDSVREVFGRDFSVERLRQEPDIASEASRGVEVIVATSGKAVVLVQGRDMARRFISAWSRRVLLEAPGVDATGVISSAPVDLQRSGREEGGVAWAIHDVHEEFERARSLRASPASRWMNLPVVASCRDSGLPANALWEEEGTPISRSSLEKRRAAVSDAFHQRMEDLGGRFRGFSNPQEMEHRMEQLEWLGVIHADGNGLGEIFINFHDYVDGISPRGQEPFGRRYLTTYRNFSMDLDETCREAYKKTLAEAFGKSAGRVPVIPVVVGGDDLTVILDGSHAINFAACFVRAFCEGTAKKEGIASVVAAAQAKQRSGGGEASRLGMAAGVAVVKPHFPFSAAYDFAEELMANAKEAKKKASFAAGSIDFHIVYDSTVSSLREIREKLDVVDAVDGRRLFLTAKPYVVLPVKAPQDAPWQDEHAFGRFVDAVRALRAKDPSDEKPCLPPHQSHMVRANLFAEHYETQEREWDILCRRYARFASLWGRASSGEGDGGKLFFQRRGTKTQVTRFLDAIEAMALFDAESWDHGEKTPDGRVRR